MRPHAPARSFPCYSDESAMQMTAGFDLDRIGEWGPRLTVALDAVVASDLRDSVQASSAGCHDDALEMIVAGVNRSRLIGVAREWLRSQHVIGYHGSRLSEEEIASVCADGLQPLVTWRRREGLEATLSRHALWSQVAERLDDVMEAIAGNGRREGQAHLTLSRGMLLTASPHYLREGSEFDRAVARELLGGDAIALLREGRSPVLITVAVPGEAALEVSERRTSDGEMSGLVRVVLQVWSDWLRDPDFDPSSRRIDVGLIFHEVIPPGWVVEVAFTGEPDLEQAIYRWPPG